MENLGSRGLLCYVSMVILLLVFPIEGRDLAMSLVDVTLSDEGDRYSARVAIETKMDDWMVSKAAWQMYHKSIENEVLYQIPLDGAIHTTKLNATAYVGDQKIGQPQPSLLQAQSNGRELTLSYMYSVADTVSRTSLTLTEFIDTARTKEAGIPVSRYSAQERDIIKVYLDDNDAGRVFARQGEYVRITCSYKTKYFYQRQWLWERTATFEHASSSEIHPLEYHVIAKSKMDGSYVTELEDYHVIVHENEDDDGFVFMSELVLESFDESKHSGIYHCMVNDWSMARYQPWLLTVDKFVELAPPGDQSIVEPSVLFPEEEVYVAIETCSKKGPDPDGTIFLNPQDPDCIVCMSLSHTVPTLLKDGVEVPDVMIWPLTVRNPHLHLVYVVMERPSENDIGTYTCVGSMFQHTTQKQATIEVNRRRK